MRKKTVKFVADTIFWYILYFLPIVSYLLFCFSEPISYLTVADNTVTEPTEIVQVIEETQSDNVIEAGDYIANEQIDFLGIGGQFSLPFTSNGSEYIAIRFTSSVSVVNYMVTSTSSLDVYGSGSWSDNVYRSITVLSDTTLPTVDYHNWFVANFSFVEPEPEPEPEPEQSTLRVVSFTNYITSAFSFLEDNIFYTSLDGAIGADGLCPLISDKGLLLYLSWFVSVYTAHLFVDFVLFIPRLAHKWLNAFTQGD